MQDWEVDLIQEMSFQGGDGYQYFMNHDLAFASIARILDFCFNNNDLEINHWIEQWFLTYKNAFQLLKDKQNVYW